jgi:hypothetical protein
MEPVVTAGGSDTSLTPTEVRGRTVHAGHAKPAEGNVFASTADAPRKISNVPVLTAWSPASQLKFFLSRRHTSPASSTATLNAAAGLYHRILAPDS